MVKEVLSLSLCTISKTPFIMMTFNNTETIACFQGVVRIYEVLSVKTPSETKYVHFADQWSWFIHFYLRSLSRGVRIGF